MLRLTFVYSNDDRYKYLTTEFCDEKVALASELMRDKSYAGMNFYQVCFEADDLVDLQVALEEVCDG